MSAIALVTGVSASSVLNGGDMAITFATAPVANDVVYLWGGHFSRSGSTTGPTTAGYTQLAIASTNSTHMGAWRKVMGSSPDTTVTAKGSGNTADSTAYAYVILRGVDTASPEDVTTTIGTGTGTNPDPPAIVPVNDGSWVIACSCSVSASTTGTISNYINTGNASSADTNPMTIAGATRLITKAASENPGAWSSWATGQWCSITIAARQARAPIFAPAVSFSPMIAQ